MLVKCLRRMNTAFSYELSKYQVGIDTVIMLPENEELGSTLDWSLVYILYQ